MLIDSRKAEKDSCHIEEGHFVLKLTFVVIVKFYFFTGS